MERTYFEINRGVGKPLEFKGLKAQYLYLFAGGIGLVILLTTILGAAGASPMLIAFLVVGGSGAVIFSSFYLNKRFGEHGLMKLMGRLSHPRFIINRKSPRVMLRRAHSGKQEKR